VPLSRISQLLANQGTKLPLNNSKTKGSYNRPENHTLWHISRAACSGLKVLGGQSVRVRSIISSARTQGTIDTTNNVGTMKNTREYLRDFSIFILYSSERCFQHYFYLSLVLTLLSVLNIVIRDKTFGRPLEALTFFSKSF
jgi:hypothetical protein